MWPSSPFRQPNYDDLDKASNEKMRLTSFETLPINESMPLEEAIPEMDIHILQTL